MSERTNFTGIITAIFLIVLIVGMLIPHVDIEALNNKFKNYQVIIALASAFIALGTGLYFYLNLNFKKEEKTSIQIQKEGLELYTKINNNLISRDERINKNSADIRTLKSDVEELKKTKRPVRRNKNA